MLLPDYNLHGNESDAAAIIILIRSEPSGWYVTRADFEVV